MGPDFTANTLKGLALKYLETNTHIFLNRDFTKIVTICEEPEFTKAVFEKILDEFVEAKILTKVEFVNDNRETEKGWILQKSLSSYSQNIEISAATVNYLGQIVERINEINPENFNIEINPLNITEADIQRVLVVLEQCLTPKNPG